jgi:hypothetical protein
MGNYLEVGVVVEEASKHHAAAFELFKKVYENKPPKD